MLPLDHKSWMGWSFETKRLLFPVDQRGKTGQGSTMKGKEEVAEYPEPQAEKGEEEGLYQG